MLWVVFFMSLLIIYLLSSWMPTLLNHRGIDLQQASWVTAAFGWRHAWRAVTRRVDGPA